MGETTRTLDGKRNLRIWCTICTCLVENRANVNSDVTTDLIELHFSFLLCATQTNWFQLQLISINGYAHQETKKNINQGKQWRGRRKKRVRKATWVGMQRTQIVVITYSLSFHMKNHDCWRAVQSFGKIDPVATRSLRTAMNWQNQLDNNFSFRNDWRGFIGFIWQPPTLVANMCQK